MKKLWGDNYFDTGSKKWKTSNMDDAGKPLKRAFVNFIMDPICKLANAVMDNNQEVMNKMLDTVGLVLT